MAVSVTGPRAVNELGGPVIPGNIYDTVELIVLIELSIQYPYIKAKGSICKIIKNDFFS